MQLRLNSIILIKEVRHSHATSLYIVYSMAQHSLKSFDRRLMRVILFNVS